jgi:hypothetical protein
LDTIEAQEAERVRFAAHQLEGPAAEWWDNYQITYPDVNAITWNQFQQAFRTTHVADGIIQLKRREFHDLRQGSHSVTKYGEIFNKLARYAPDDVSTDAKRQSEFMRGLNDEISIQLVAVRYNSYQELLDRAVVVESKHMRMENRKRKNDHNVYNQGLHRKTRTSQDGNGNSGHPRNGGNGHNNHGRNGHHHNGHKSENHHNSGKGNGHNNGGNNGRNNKNFVKKDISQVECFKCHKNGHYANDCPERKNDEGNETNQIEEEVHVNHINTRDSSKF